VIIKRIEYYARKSAAYSQLRRRWPHRHRRLVAYKAALDRRINAEWLDWKSREGR